MYVEGIHWRSVCNKASKPASDEMKPKSVGKDSVGPDVLYDDLRKHSVNWRMGKQLVSTGIDGIPAEILNAAGCMCKYELFEICSDMYIKVNWPRNLLSFQ